VCASNLIPIFLVLFPNKIKATEIAKKLNEIRASNMVLLGCLSNFIPIKKESWIGSIKKNVPQRAVKVNLNAFEEGRKLIELFWLEAYLFFL